MTPEAEAEVQAAGGLRIAQQIPPLRRHLAHEMAVAGKVAPGAARHRAGGDIVLHPRQFWDIGIAQLRLHAGPAAHLAEVAEQAKAGDVGHRLHPVDGGKRGAGEVYLAHGLRR